MKRIHAKTYVSSCVSCRKRDAAVRFWEKVDKDGPTPQHCPELGPCHVWTGATYSNGYGRFYISGKRTVVAHRFSFFIARGRWPKPLGMHRCDNPACVRDDHIIEGSNASNMADMVSKGRAASGDRNASRCHPERVRRGDAHGLRVHPERVARGEGQGASKLTDGDVRAIRRLYRHPHNQRELAAMFGVCQATISLALSGRQWAHVH